MQAILKDNLLGAYLGGSFAHGGWHSYSDVDFDVVIERDLNPPELADLKVLHARVYISDSYWARHLEGAYFPKAILGDLDRTAEPIWYLDNGSLNFERSTHDNTLVNRWVLREDGVVLTGPEPATWIPPVPVTRLRAEVWETMQAWGEEILTGAYQIDNRWAQAFAVLMYCRMLHSLEIGEVQSKPAGAAWAKDALDLRWIGLIDDALGIFPHQYEKIYQPADSEKVRQTREFIRYALAEGRTRWGMGK